MNGINIDKYKKFIGEEFKVSYLKKFSKLKKLRDIGDMVIAELEDGTTVNALLLKDKDNIDFYNKT